MNSRIIKETRSVLPVFCVMVLACAAPRLIWSRETAGGVGLAIFTICCLILGASCFGNEYQWRTMPLLLAQPVPRRKIWNEKMLVLGIALALGLTLFWLCVPLPERDSYLFLVLVPFCVFSTAPYMALTIKNTLMAAMLTFGLPFGLCGSLTLLMWMFSRVFPVAQMSLETSIETHAYAYAGTAAAIYCGVCYWLGYRAFVKLEAVDVQAREIALPAGLESALAGPMNRLLPRYRGPWASLLRKELQIQKAAFVLAGVMCLVSILMALAWDVDHTELFAAMSATPIAVLVFVIPMIVSGGSVAEERGWGVNGWQLALPVSARKQWAAKMFTVVFVSVLLGVVLPLMLWISDGWVFHLPIGPGPLHLERLHDLPPPPDFFRGLLVALDCVLGYLFLVGLGVFTSSLCANSGKAVIINIGLMIFGGTLIGVTLSGINKLFARYLGINLNDLEPGTIPGLLILGAFFAGVLCVAQHLARSNYRNDEPNPRGMWMQLATVSAVIIGGAGISWLSLVWYLSWPLILK